jgi:hypothetical protein
MGRGGSPLCKLCSHEAVRHVELKTSKTHIKNHLCVRHELEVTRDIQRNFGLAPTTRPIGDKCRRGTC